MIGLNMEQLIAVCQMDSLFIVKNKEESFLFTVHENHIQTSYHLLGFDPVLDNNLVLSCFGYTYTYIFKWF